VKNHEGQWTVEGPLSADFQEKIKVTHPFDYWDNPHNLYIQLFYEAGWIALAILGFVFYFLWQIFKFSKRQPITVASMSALIFVAIYSMTQFPFNVARLAHFIPVITGIFIVSARDEW
jgi:O-antigen ligase